MNDLAPTGLVHAPAARRTWGMGDIGFGVLFVAILTIALTVVGTVSAAVTGTDFSGMTTGALPPLIIGTSLAAQQSSTVAWVALVSKLKGTNMADDFGFTIRLSDIRDGFAVGVGLIAAAVAVEAGLTALLGAPDGAADNTGIITSAEGSWWLWVLIVGVVIGAPVSEELFFRGLVQRAVGHRFGTVTAVIVSTITFTVIHFPDSVDGLWVLWGTIGMIGAVLGVIAARTRSLGIPIVAHVVFNSAGIAAAFAA